MFKIDKGTHMMIMITFAIVFVVVYLYFTITDVRKMQREIVRLSEEVSSLQKHHLHIKQQQHPEQTQQTVHVPKVEINEKPAVSPVVDDGDDSESVVTEDIRATLECSDDEEQDIEPHQEVEQDFDESKEQVDHEVEKSKETNNETEEAEIKSVHSNIDEPHFEFNIKSVSENEFPSAALSVEDIKSLKYDELREQCKIQGLSTRGTKENMIQRLVEYMNMNA
jgi:hypothetical protein